MPPVLGSVPSDPTTLARLAAFFRPQADPWERLAIDLPPQVFGRASTRAFDHYLGGPARVPARSLDEICAWLRACEPVADADLFLEADFWQHPSTFEQVRKGDCEDHALWAWRQLVRHNIPALFVAGLWRDTPHTWVQVCWNGTEGVLETTRKTGDLFVPLVLAKTCYRPGLAVDGNLQTYVYQGYQAFHHASRESGPCTTSVPPKRAARRRSALRRLPPPTGEIVVLAGGRSSRMGRDKARLRVQGRSLLAHVRAAAAPLDLPVRVLRRDRVPGLGPLGGVATALATTPAPVVLFLSCDMPLITATWLRRVLAALPARGTAAFTVIEGRWSFPFALRRTAAPVVDALVARGRLALAGLAEALSARRVPVPARRAAEGLNVNTPGDLAALREHLGRRPAARLRPKPVARPRP